MLPAPCSSTSTVLLGDDDGLTLGSRGWLTTGSSEILTTSDPWETAAGVIRTS